MKLEEIESNLMEKEFELLQYSKDGKVTAKHKVVLRELTQAQSMALRQKCTKQDQKGNRVVDQDQLTVYAAAQMLLLAPFESNEGKNWQALGMDEKRDYISRLPNAYAYQIARMIQEMLPEGLNDEEKNL